MRISSAERAMRDRRKRGCRNMINMLNVSGQTELLLAAAQNMRRTKHGAKEIVQSFRFRPGRRIRCAAGADARIFPLAADVAAARPRGRDAPVPPLAAPS